MNINISRQNIYLLSLSIFLLLFVLIFSFALLIPEGKEYRNKKADIRKDRIELRKYENFRDESLEELTELKSNNVNIIRAFDTEFDIERFQKTHAQYFNTLKILSKEEQENEGVFSVYEVNTTSHISSPQSFYEFLDGVNKSDWMISVNFPIKFKRENDMIRSSFTMKVYGKVYGVVQDLNATQSTTTSE